MCDPGGGYAVPGWRAFGRLNRQSDGPDGQGGTVGRKGRSAIIGSLLAKRTIAALLIKVHEYQ